MSLTFENGSPYGVNAGDGWTPQLLGDVFCSPLCGFKCKKADFDRATEQANNLVGQLGTGWRARVWENCGWHFDVKKGDATVSLQRDGLYEANILLSFDNVNQQRISEQREDPRAAVEAVIEELNRKVSAFKRALASLSLASLEIVDV